MTPSDMDRRGTFLPVLILTFFLLPGGVLFAHGEEVVDDDPTIHPITQIGLPEARMGHDHGAAAEGVVGHTRGEVSALIRDSQEEENFRSITRFVLLSLSIIGLMFLFYPRRRLEGVATGESTQKQTGVDGQPSAPIASTSNSQ